MIATVGQETSAPSVLTWASIRTNQPLSRGEKTLALSRSVWRSDLAGMINTWNPDKDEFSPVLLLRELYDLCYSRLHFRQQCTIWHLVLELANCIHDSNACWSQLNLNLHHQVQVNNLRRENTYLFIMTTTMTEWSHYCTILLLCLAHTCCKDGRCMHVYGSDMIDNVNIVQCDLNIVQIFALICYHGCGSLHGKCDVDGNKWQVWGKRSGQTSSHSIGRKICWSLLSQIWDIVQSRIQLLGYLHLLILISFLLYPYLQYMLFTMNKPKKTSTYC